MQELNSKTMAMVAVAYAAIFLLFTGTNSLCSPVSMNGPFNYPNPGPFLALAVGSALMRAATRGMPAHKRKFSGVAILAVLGPALANFYKWPPIDDGAYFMLRYGDHSIFSDNYAPPTTPDYILALWIAGLYAIPVLIPAGKTDLRILRILILPVILLAMATVLVVIGTNMMYSLT